MGATSGLVRVAAVAVVQLALVGVAVAGPLSARLTGDEYLLAVQPVDPIDPFRGAYVALSYPGLGQRTVLESSDGVAPGGRGTVFVPLVADGDLWRGGEPTRDRPADGPYLRCDDREWQVRCGIESWFLPQSRAQAVEDAVRDGRAVARVKVDGRGNAALVDVEVRPAG
jgi:uncharacterized membrane-anchored protein